MYCSRCKSDNLYYFHEYDIPSFWWLFGAVLCSLFLIFIFRAVVPFWYSYCISLPLAAILILSWVYAFIRNRYRPRIRIICKDCGFSWYPHG